MHRRSTPWFHHPFFRRSIALGTAVILGAALVQPTANAQQAPVQAQLQPGKAEDLPPLPSHPGDAVTPEWPAGDYGQLEQAAPRIADPDAPARKAAGEQVGYVEGESKLVERKPTTDIYANPDGTKAAKLYQDVVNVPEDGDGALVPVDLTLESEGGRIKPKQAAAQVSLPERTDGDAAISVTTPEGGQRASLEFEGLADRAAEIDGQIATYRDVQPGVDLELYSMASGAKHVFVLHRAVEEVEWHFTLDVPPGHTPEQQSDGAILVKDADGAVKFVVAAPKMWDDVRDERSAEWRTGPVTQRLERAGDTWKVVLVADRAWVDAPERKFPIKVDPGLHTLYAAFDAYVSDAFKDTNYDVDWESGLGYVNKVGYWPGAGENRTYAFYDFLPHVWGKQIVNATWNAYWVNSHLATPTNVRIRDVACDWGRTSITWNNQPCLGAATKNSTGVGGKPTTIDITDWVAWWAGGGGNYRGIAVDTTEGQNGWKKMAAAEAGPSGGASAVIISYNDHPTQPANLGCTDCTPHSREVQLRVKSDDANNDKRIVQYFVSTESNVMDTYFASGQAEIQPGQGEAGWQPPKESLRWNQKYFWQARVRDDHMPSGSWVYSSVWNFTPINQTPPVPPQNKPVDRAVVSTKQPVLGAGAVTDPDAGDVVQYEFSIATGKDGRTGLVAKSGWIDKPEWTVPNGVLKDGVGYTWTVRSRDRDQDSWSQYAAARQLRLDMRVGSQSVVATDTTGPLSINLANGNLSTGLSTPRMSTVGGEVGLNLAYNSLLVEESGLVGSYFTGDSRTGILDTEEPVLVRTDPQVSFNWGDQSPYDPVVGRDGFRIRWQGFLKVPTSGSYALGGQYDDGLRVWIGDDKVFDQWTDNCTCGGPAKFDGAVAKQLSAGVAYPVRIEYREFSGPADIALWARHGDGQAVPVPASWFTPTASALPSGWTLSADVAAVGNGYTKASLTESGVTITDSTGASHAYSKTSDGGYRPPAGEYGTLSRDEGGKLTLIDTDGSTHVFGASGQLEAVTSPADARKPAAARLEWTQSDLTSPVPRLTKITDPVSGRAITLHYAGDQACAPPGGYHPTPPGFLCAVKMPDGATSNLFYLNGRLGRFQNPGGEYHDFGFNEHHLLDQLRTPLAIEWIVADSLKRDSYAPNYRVDYDGPTSRRAAKLSSPEPTGFEQNPTRRVQHTYSYGSDSTEVAIVGMATGPGFARKVTRDLGGRTLTDTDGSGRTKRHEWAEDDKQLSVTDSAGRKSTTVYDAKGNPTESYGPAPARCFGGDRRPLAPAPEGCDKIPTSRTGYDEGFTGLGATWWNNPSFSGDATAYSTSPVNTDWRASAPVTDVDFTSALSGRLTGALDVRTAGSYEFSTTEDDPSDGLRVYVDDNLVLDRTYSSQVLASGPLGYWRLGENTTTMRDSSGHGRDGTYSGSAKQWQAGALPDDQSTSVDFHGGQAQVAPAPFDLEGALTLEAWVKPRPNDAKGGWQDIISRWNGGDDKAMPYEFTITPEGKLEFRQIGATPGIRRTVSDDSVSLNQWNHAVVTRGADNQITFYLNGKKSGGAKLAVPAKVNAVPLTIGNRPGGATTDALLDEVAVYDRALTEKEVAGHSGAAGAVNTPKTKSTLSQGSHRVRVEYSQRALTGNLTRETGAAAVLWKRDGETATTVPADVLTPDYGLTTSTTTADSDSRPDRRTTTSYTGEGHDPAYGLVTSTALDPAGLNLVNGTGYEKPGDGLLRRTTRTLPSGTPMAHTYYGNTETRPNPCQPGAEPVVQSGLSKTSGGVSGRVDERVYDLRGRVVAEAAPGGWTCTAYDSRGRMTKIAHPASGSTPARVVSYDYAVGGDPLATSVSDSAGTITTRVDLLGRIASYTDVHGLTTIPELDLGGRVVRETTKAPGQAGDLPATETTYDDAGRVLTLRVGGELVATATYDSAGELSGVTYGNGSALRSLGQDASGRVTSLAWRTSDGRDVVSSVTRSKSGMVVDESLGGVDARPDGPNYSYDAAGRLVEAYVPGHHYSYDFTSPVPQGCPEGTVGNAGRNTNRVRLVDRTASGTTETGYCYDSADRLVAVVGDTQVTDIRYDESGNTTRFTSGGSTTHLEWDSEGRNTSARSEGVDPAEVTYRRDAQGRIVERVEVVGGKSRGNSYGHTADGDTADVILDAAGQVVSRTVSLPGGALLTLRGDGTTYDHPSVRGDLVLTTDAKGEQVGELPFYSPFGEPLKPNGTPDADAVPDNLPDGVDYGWLGQHQRPYEHAGALSLVQMGARPYSPLLGRFLSIDPVDGGSANDYDYANGDPVNQLDLDGNWPDWGKVGSFVMKNRGTIASAGAAVGCMLTGLLACGIFTAGAYAVNAQQRIAEQGFRKSLKANAADLVLTVGTFGLFTVPVGLATKVGGTGLRAGVSNTPKALQKANRPVNKNTYAQKQMVAVNVISTVVDPGVVKAAFCVAKQTARRVACAF
ncbi:MSHA biogenesis protein MshQ [Actinosynnema pretiosum subsp. pretiosum]|nr:MSHA biogenesis protein MshQ [Actinosynnema pretiosum subsp. pretiosum]